MEKSVFLSARWEYLAMFNYCVDAAILEPSLPPGTELDLWQGKALISIVGFMFANTRVLGVKWPLHSNFEEVNLRYYVKQIGSNEKRGVGFVSEIVPRPIIAAMANGLYNERYRALPMKHFHTFTDDEVSVGYQWKHNGNWNSLSIKAGNKLKELEPGSEEEFILEHYYGYNRLSHDTSIMYRVEHPRWQIFPVTSWALNVDVDRLYGSAFAPFVQGVEPHSVFLARGSEIIVRKPERLRNQVT